jgi:hypothetical protein
MMERGINRWRNLSQIAVSAMEMEEAVHEDRPGIQDDDSNRFRCLRIV